MEQQDKTILQQDKTIEFETKSIKQLLWIYALPAILSQIIASVYNIADRIFLGQYVGPLAIAGLAITLPIMNIINAFGSLVSAGSSARMSIVLGQKEVKWAEKILGNSLLLNFVLGTLLIIFSYAYMDKILTMFGATADTIAYAREYMHIVIPGTVLTTINYNLTGIIRVSGYPNKSMLILASGAVLNIILDAIFIYVLDMGISGAAWATTISMACSLMASICHFLQKSSFIRFKKHAWTLKLYVIRNIMMIGISPFSMNVAASAVVAFLNKQLIRFGGDIAVGAYGIVNSFGSICILLMIGLCQGMQPIAGYNYGAGHPERLREVYKCTRIASIIVGLVGTILAFTIPQVLLRAFTKEAHLIEIAIPAMHFMMLMFPLNGFTITNSQFFQSIDKPWIAMVTSLSRQVLFLIPLIYIVPNIFVHLGYSGLTGVWASMTISDALAAILAFTLMMTQRKVFTTARHGIRQLK